MYTFFTLLNIITKFWDKGIGLISTACFKDSSPTNELRNVSLKRAAFNDFNWCVNEFGTLVGRWIYNGLILHVSGYHRSNEVMLTTRKKLCVTELNKKDVD